ncbi:rhamnosyltransferase WsaF family glycosyltransferase [Sulfitobacter sp.]|uniref:rhamnosyltransferase WsaF family glycosyltransferase n=1 Tax=Sulfitobacter sp. TaxID=1903071 RepID=UPI003001DDEA
MSPHILIALAVFRPNPAHLKAQLQSLAAQTGCKIRIIAVIADAVSGPLVDEIADALELDLIRVDTDQEMDAVRAFEAGLAEALLQIETMSLADTEDEPLIALCDQDDIWHPEKLMQGCAELERSGAQMVHSDARLVAADGITVLQKSMFAFEKRHKHPGLRGLLYRNNITGMTLLMRPQVARIALPFPAQSGVHFYHDLWLGLIASATGGVAFIDAPLVDYRQHESNVMGAVDRTSRKIRKLRRPDAMWLRREAAGYGLARYLARFLRERLKDASIDGRLSGPAPSLKSLAPYLKSLGGTGRHFLDTVKLAITGHLGLARIALGFGVVSMGRTVWSLRMALGDGWHDARVRFDTKLYSLSPGVKPTPALLDDERPEKPQSFATLADARKMPRWTPAFTEDEAALTILVPTLNPSEIFAGVVTAFDIGLGLAARGFRVRFVATDLPVSSPAASRSFVLRRLSREAAESGAAARVSLHCGVKTPTLPAHRGDVYLATAWWSAHVAQTLIETHQLKQGKFFYLIQDFEPNFYPWGSEFADAIASYGFDFVPVFNTTLLRDYFAAQEFDFATPDALAFHPSIDIAHYTKGARPARAQGKPRRLALYGRPEVARNMYEMAIEALAGFISAEGLGPDDVEIVSIGLVHAPVDLPNGLKLASLGKLPWEDYPAYLLSVDVGLSLMYSPHPSHPPIEMAASGVRVVTNGFGPKNLSTLSAAITSVPAHVPALVGALHTAWTAGPVADADRQIDLGQLGLDQHSMLDRLADTLETSLPRTNSSS